MLAELVLPGRPAADIGTDHGFVPIYLLRENIVPYAVMTDINEGPLKIAKWNLESEGISELLYSLRLGDGLMPLEKSEVASVIIAGMGGELIESILGEDSEKSHSFDRYILQPRTRANELRYYLSTNAFRTVDYRLVKEKGRICEIIVVEPCATAQLPPDTALVSEFLLSNRDPLIPEFIDAKLKAADLVIESLKEAESGEGKDLADIWTALREELADIRESIDYET